MQKRYASDFFPEDSTPTDDYPGVAVYLASDVDARIAELEQRYERALSCLTLADSYIPTDKIDEFTAKARSLMERST